MNKKIDCKITTIPCASALLVTSNNRDNIESAKKALCLLAFGVDNFIDFKKKCKNYDLKIKTQFSFGNEPSTYNLKPLGSPFWADVNGNLSTTSEDMRKFICRKLLFELCLHNVCQGDIEIRTGYSGFYLRDTKYTMLGGWENNFKREYYGNGMYTNSTNTIFGGRFTGIQMTYNYNNFCCRTGLYVPNEISIGEKELIPSFDIKSYGFDPRSNNLCDATLTYKSEIPCPTELYFNCQRSYHLAAGSLGSSSTRAASVFADHESDVMRAYNLGCISDINGIQTSGAFSWANCKDEDEDTARVIKWSLGCVSKCKQLKCVPEFIGSPLAYGLNISTPTYVQRNDIDDDEETDGWPLNCEVNCLTKVCGFNVPIFFNLLNSARSTEDSGPEEEGKVCIFGVRPYSIIEFEKEGKLNDTINCDVEGGLDENEDLEPHHLDNDSDKKNTIDKLRKEKNNLRKQLLNTEVDKFANNIKKIININ